MVKITVSYEGRLRAESRHEPSGATLRTVAPRDNLGDGSSFSPTDLLATSLVTCMLTTMGIVAQRNDIAFPSARGEVVKEMTQEGPRRVERLRVELMLPAVPEEHRPRLEAAAMGCPVKRSLHPEVETPTTFHWAEV
jgi:putative redox protein